MADEPRKRSRFDQTEAEPKRSRFDRRSRSPPSRTSAADVRSRSPLRSEGRDLRSASPAAKKDAAAAAAAAAARINAQIQARKAAEARSPSGTASPSRAPVVRAPPNKASASVTGDIYTQDGDYIKDIEINDLRNKYTLTKGATQKMIKEETGADVTTRGEYYPDKSLATAASPPLYLHITSTSKEGLEKAVAKIEELMKQELPNLVDERRLRRRDPEPVERDELGRRKWPEERIPIDLEPIPGFNLRAQVVGHGGAYVKHIQNETRCRVQIKGRGSGFIEHSTGRESDEPMFLHVAGPDPNDVQRGKELCEDLLDNVKKQYEAFKERGGSHSHGHYNGQRGYGRGDSYTPRGGDAHSPPQGAMSPQGASGTPGATDYAAQYAQYYGGQDPYAQYGGYQNYMAMWYQYYGQGQPGQDGTVPPAPGVATEAPGTGAPPPPPAEQPPPPPPGAPGTGVPPPPPTGGPPGYNSVPPPPGM